MVVVDYVININKKNNQGVFLLKFSCVYLYLKKTRNFQWFAITSLKSSLLASNKITIAEKIQS